MSLGRYLIAGVLVSALGCIPLSIHPLYTDDVLVYRPELEGVWGEDESDGSWSFAPGGNKSYILTIREGDDPPGILTAHLAELDGSLWLDMTVEDLGDAELPEFPAMHLLPLHSFWQVEVEEDVFRIRTFDPEWLEERFEKKRFWIDYEKWDDWFVFTAKPERLQRFVKKWMRHSEVFGEWTTLKRQRAVTPGEEDAVPAK